MRVVALVVLSGCTGPAFCEEAAEVSLEIDVMTAVPSEVVLIDEPCVVRDPSLSSLTLYCAGIAPPTSTVTLAIETLPAVGELFVADDPVQVTFIERRTLINEDVFLRIREGGDVRIIAQRHGSLMPDQTLLPTEATLDPYAPFSVKESEVDCGTDGLRYGDKTRHGIHFQSAEADLTIYDRQTVDTTAWSFRVSDAYRVEGNDDCAGCGGARFNFLIARRL